MLNKFKNVQLTLEAADVIQLQSDTEKAYHLGVIAANKILDYFRHHPEHFIFLNMAPSMNIAFPPATPIYVVQSFGLGLRNQCMKFSMSCVLN